MQKLDLTKTYKTYYTAKKQPQVVDIEAASFLSVCDVGDPSDKNFTLNIEALYAVAYAVKFIFKAQDKDFVVAKLEGLWWYDEAKAAGLTMAEIPQKIPRSEWQYRLMLRVPEYVTKAVMQEAVKKVMDKKQLQKATRIEFFKMKEGKSVQMLHVGPFDTEPETLSQLQGFMIANGLEKNGQHHEIYLSDFRKTAADKLKTILREPVK